MLPDFIGIGVNKAGSTWLHDLLDSHPRVWVPVKRKEVRFFTENYDLGLEWYDDFFPSDDEAGEYDAVGEITPHYLYMNGTAERIASLGTVKRLILTLRDPVERLHSAYWFRVRVSGFDGTFEDYIRERPGEVDRGLYAKHLQTYLRHFSRDQILILIFERMIRDVPATRETLADFLGLDVTLFPPESGTGKSNVRYVPRFRGAYQKAYRLGRSLRSHDLDWIVNGAKRFGLPAVFGKRKSPRQTQMNSDTRRRLEEIFAEDIKALEGRYGLDCSAWRSRPVKERS